MRRSSAGYYRDAGVDLEVREPSASTDAPKLLEAGRAEFAILDIHDLGIARERGLDVVGVAPIVQRPLAAVIAANRPRSAARATSRARTVGVTGLPSDDAVLDSVLEADGADPDAVDRVTIGFNAVSSLAAGKVDAATAFWNAEGVALQAPGDPDPRVSRRRLRGARDTPSSWLVHLARSSLRDDPELVRAVREATGRGYRFACDASATDGPRRPARALPPASTATSSAPSFGRCSAAHAFEPGQSLRRASDADRAWARWDVDARHPRGHSSARPGGLFSSPLVAASG